MESTYLVQPVMAKPFANGANATKTTNISNYTDADNMNYEDGFPAIFSTLIKDGGKFIDRADINGILHAISKVGWYALCGGLVQWNQNMCTAIGGYPSGARVWYKREGKMILIESTIENNEYNPESIVDTEIMVGTEIKVVWKSVTGMVVDTAMNSSSTNAVQNKVIKSYIDTGDATAVKNSGDETIAGVKTFSSSPVVPQAAADDNTNRAASITWVRNFWAVIVSVATNIAGIWNFVNGVKAKKATLTQGTSTDYPSVNRDGTGESLLLCGGTTALDGASLELKGKDNGGTNAGGGFVLQAKNPNTTSYLTGTPTGGITWTTPTKTYPLVRTVNGNPADENGNVVATSAAGAVYITKSIASNSEAISSGTAGIHGEYTVQHDCYLSYTANIDNSNDTYAMALYLKMTLPSGETYPVSYSGTIALHTSGKSLAFCGPVKQGTKIGVYFGSTIKDKYIHRSGYNAVEFELA